MKKSIIFSATMLIALFGTQVLIFSQGCHGGNSSSGGHNHGETTAKAKSSETSSTGKMVTYYTCAMHPEVVNKEPGKCPKCGMELVQKASGIEKNEQSKDSVYYTCSMHPEVKEAKPGNCPKCGMTLIKKSDVSGKHEMKMMCPMMGGMNDMNKIENKETSDKSGQAKKDTVIYTCSMHPEIKSDKPGKCPKCGMVLIKKEVKETKTQSAVFQCPMKCEGDKIYDKAGNCPKCGMNLAEVKTEKKKE